MALYSYYLSVILSELLDTGEILNREILGISEVGIPLASL